MEKMDEANFAIIKVCNNGEWLPWALD